MAERGQRLAPAALAAEVVERDRSDSERMVAPLRRAPDAVLIDTDGLTLEEVVALVVDHVRGGQERGRT
jgi:CMP/dCMP kinase